MKESILIIFLVFTTSVLSSCSIIRAALAVPSAAIGVASKVLTPL